MRIPASDDPHDAVRGPTVRRWIRRSLPRRAAAMRGSGRASPCLRM